MNEPTTPGARAPMVAIIGRPNVGKSTLFNRLTRSRDALVADIAGLTRDRLLGEVRDGDRRWMVVDTGGLAGEGDILGAAISTQAWAAAREADVVVFVVDAASGLTAADEAIAATLRRLGRPVAVAVNKSDRLPGAVAAAEFHALGLGEPLAIAAAHNRGTAALLERIREHLPAAAPPAAAEDTGAIRVCIIGRPNAGKSTLVNRALGEERVITSDRPGTTRDAVVVPFEREGQRYELIDTAGLRRRARVREDAERLSAVKTLAALRRSDVAVLVVDAAAGIGEHDARLLGMALEAGRAVVVAINKWDHLPPGQRAAVRQQVRRRLHFVDYVPVVTMSALHGTGLGALFRHVRAAHASAHAEIPTPRLNRVLEDAVGAHPPPLVGRRRVKLRYAHLADHRPPRIVIHGTQVQSLPDSYRRYLERSIREAFGLVATPLVIELRQAHNPYAGRGGTRSRGRRRR